MAKVSILMNCYNSEKYLKETIDSVIAQTFTDWEIIFWDNQSKDSSAQIAKSYNDDRIKYFYAPNHTPLGEARNLALNECKAEYVAFLDTDDIWLSSKLEKQIAIMDSNKDIAMCYAGAIEINEVGNQINSFVPLAKRGMLLGVLLSYYEIYMQSVIIRNSLLQSIEEPNFDNKLKFSPDCDLFMRIAAVFNSCAIDEILIKYRVLQNSLTAQTKEVHGYEFGQMLDKLEERYPDKIEQFSKEFKIARAQEKCEHLKYHLSVCNFRQATRYLDGLLTLIVYFKVKHVYLFLRAVDICGIKNKIKKALK